MQLKQRLIAAPLLGRLLLPIYRLKVGLPYAARPLAMLGRWLVTSHETTNFTYDLTPINRGQLAALVAHVTGASHAAVLGYFAELEGDRRLREHIAAALERSPARRVADAEVRYGRRIGWYAFVRATRPRLVIETGVDKGLGACVITAALARNAAEGHPGRYYGTDINPRAGYLLGGEYARFGEVLYGDSIESLRALSEPIDLFINDSDHSADYEAREYAIVGPRLTAGAIVLGDNAHASESLLQFALASGRQFLYFQEQPARHWYPGAGIGVAFGQ
jgi:predicted O-methyltransferase YrrM